MGAWGHGNFDNDDALDWACELEEARDNSVIDAAFDSVTGTSGDYLEAPDCCNALAAAEVVAALNGKPPSFLPDEVTGWIRGKPAPDATLIAKARQAVDAVGGKSELKELWEDVEGLDEWNAVLENLRARL